MAATRPNNISSTPAAPGSTHRKRRSSGMSAGSNLDKEGLTQALDTIHHTASKTQTFTAFSEYTAPPSLISPKEGLGITDLPGSLTGFYNRLKETVGAIKSGPRQEEEEFGDTISDASLRSTIPPVQAQRLGPGTNRNPSPAPSQLSVSRDPKSAAKDSPSLRPSKSSTINDSVVSSPTLQTEFKPSERSLKPKLTTVNGPVSTITLSEASVSAVPGKSGGDSLTPSNKPIDAAEALRAADGRISRLRLDTEEPSLSSETSSMNADLNGSSNNVKIAPSTRGISSQNGSEHNQARPAGTTKKTTNIDSGQNRESSVTQQGNSTQQRLQLLNMTRVLSSADDAVSTSASAVNDEDEEALSSVGHLPLRPVKSNANQGSNNMLSQLRNKLLGKEYWMRDENAKDCFYCGDAFSTFRRKHHCRICGQIFDSKCTTLINGAPFGQSSTVRVCKPCEGIINGYDDSSEFSDDGSVLSGFRTRLGSNNTHDISPARSFTSLKAAKTESKPESIPSIAIPTRRLTEDSKRRSTILEIDAEPRRPGSARSLKPALVQRSHTTGHRRLHSKHSLKLPQRSFDEQSPFSLEKSSLRVNRPQLPVFHSDNVIDPDLADYLSDDDSSENEQLSLAEALHGDRGAESARTGLAGLLSTKRKSRLGEAFSRDADNASLSSSTRPSRSRSLRNRNLSISSNLNLRAGIRPHRLSMLSQSSPYVEGSPVLSNLKQFDSPLELDVPMGLKSPEVGSTDLNSLDSISSEHVRQLLNQLLTGFGVNSKSSWEKVLMPIILKASQEVVQDVQGGDDLDIRHYIKLKKIAGGRPNDSSIYSGIVFTKNLALKSMARNLSHPNILILTFPLEYARHQRHFMSLEPVIRQEREYLQNLVHRIAALKPNLLLVERNISGLALEYLDQAGISTAYNVKRSVLEAVSRMAQTRIITSIDKLAVKPAQAGHCDSFYLKTFMHKGQRKTCMFLTGCPKELGCTIVLRGQHEETLSKVKRITEFMIYVAYNLKLEASFMRDEFAYVPQYTSRATTLPDKEPINQDTSGSKLVANNDESAIENKNVAHLPASVDASRGQTVNSIAESGVSVNIDGTDDEIKLPNDTPMPSFYSDMMERNKDAILSCSPCVRFMQPYLVVRAREQERRLMYLKSIRDKETDLPTENEPSQFMLITPDMLSDNLQDAPTKVREVIRAVQDAQYDKAVHNYKTQKKQWEVYVAGAQDMFAPFSHQNIAFLYSIVCASTSVPCKDPKVHAIRFYNEHDEDAGFVRDVPLGQYIEARCMEANSICSEDTCDSKMLDHRHQYVHAEGQLSVTIEAHPPKLQGFQEIILMWSVCRVCGEETQVTPMSEYTWKYSWGKYLELSFWGHDLRPRATSCNHDLHKQYIRYFGYKNIAVRFQYDKIALLEIVVPRTRITWKVSNDLKFKNDVFLKVEERINKFMNSVKARLKGIHVENILLEKVDSFKEEIDRLKDLAQEHHTFLIEKLREKYMGSKYFEIIPFNRAIRAMEEKSVEWDNIFQEFDQNYFPSEKDIRRLATLQLKKIFLDRDDSTESLSFDEKTASTSMTNSILTGQTTPEDVASIVSPSKMSTKEAHEMLSSVVEDNLGATGKEEPSASSPEESRTAEPRMSDASKSVSDPDVQHLDLAVRPETLVKTVSEQSDITIGRRVLESSPVRGQEQITEEPESILSASVTSDANSEFDGVNQDTTQNTRPDQENIRRKSGFRSAIPLYRAHSQPARDRREGGSSVSGPTTPMPVSSASNATSKRLGFKKASPEEPKHHERKPSDRFGISAFKANLTQSMIPRSTLGRKRETKVSELAKHFEALSREFERERRRDKQRASKARQSRAFPSAAAAPIIEEFRNFHEAVGIERDSLEDSNEAHDLAGGEKLAHNLSKVNNPASLKQSSSDPTSQEVVEDHTEDTADDTGLETETETEDHAQEVDNQDSEHVAAPKRRQSSEKRVLSGENSMLEEEEPTPSIPDSTETDLKIDLPKHEKTSLMRLLTNFWAERSASGWSPLEYALNPTDHVFADSDIIVREDEPSSLIAFVLGSDAYQAKLRGITSQHANTELLQREKFVSDHFLTGEDQAQIQRSLLQSTGTHFKYQFQEGSAKMMCKVFFVEQFEAVRRKCGIDSRFIESLSRCLKWDSKGGKTKSVFLKTLDDRLVLKSLSPIETQAFVRFAPSYFTLMGEALFHDLPSVIAKMVGFYQIVIKNPVTGVEFNWFLLVMENLFYDRVPTRTFDLKGSMRNRRIQPTGEQNEVLLDENMVEYIFEKPLFAREHSKRLLGYSVFNDTLFLARQNVMDYSLMVAIDEEKKELVVGIIDCIRTYTWDKKLESWMKDRGKNRPTVTSPKEYKNRFRAAMDRYVLQAPTCWHQFSARSGALRETQDEERQARDEAEDGR